MKTQSGPDLIKETRTELYCSLFLDVTKQEKHSDNKDEVTGDKFIFYFLAFNILKEDTFHLIYSYHKK